MRRLLGVVAPLALVGLSWMLIGQHLAFATTGQYSPNPAARLPGRAGNGDRVIRALDPSAVDWTDFPTLTFRLFDLPPGLVESAFAVNEDALIIQPDRVESQPIPVDLTWVIVGDRDTLTSSYERLAAEVTRLEDRVWEVQSGSVASQDGIRHSYCFTGITWNPGLSQYSRQVPCEFQSSEDAAIFLSNTLVNPGLRSASPPYCPEDLLSILSSLPTPSQADRWIVVLLTQFPYEDCPSLISVLDGPMLESLMGDDVHLLVMDPAGAIRDRQDQWRLGALAAQTGGAYCRNEVPRQTAPDTGGRISEECQTDRASPALNDFVAERMSRLTWYEVAYTSQLFYDSSQHLIEVLIQPETGGEVAYQISPVMLSPARPVELAGWVRPWAYRLWGLTLLGWIALPVLAAFLDEDGVEA